MVATDDYFKGNKFVLGLRQQLKEKVEPFRLRVYQYVVQNARVIEDGRIGANQTSTGKSLPGGADCEGGFKKAKFERGGSSSQKGAGVASTSRGKA